MPFMDNPAKNNWQGGASFGLVKKHFDYPNNQLTNVPYNMCASRSKDCSRGGGVPAAPLCPIYPWFFRICVSQWVCAGPLPHLHLVPLVQS